MRAGVSHVVLVCVAVRARARALLRRQIVLMDEVHNLVRPSAEILRNEKRMEMLRRLRQLLRTAENSVIIGLSGTPLCDVPAEALALRNLIKGRHHQSLTDEGFVSYYMETPPSVFPRVTPLGLPRSLPPSVFRRVPLRLSLIHI